MSAKGAVPAGMRICASKSRRAALHLPSRLVVPCGVARSTVSTLIIVSLLSAASLLRVMYLKKEAASDAISRHQPSSAVVTSTLRMCGHQMYPSVP